MDRTDRVDTRQTDDRITAGQPDDPVPAWLVLVVGGVSGAVAGAAMFGLLAAVSVAQSRPFSYPFNAVQALMSGRRVLPEVRGPLRGASPADVIVGPVLFLLPAIAVGLVVTWWMLRRSRSRNTPDAWWTVAVVTAVPTLALFLLLVVALGFGRAEPPVQRMSSGQGVRELGLGAWIAAHLVYVAALVAVSGPLQRATEALRRRRTERQPVTGEAVTAT